MTQSRSGLALLFVGVLSSAIDILAYYLLDRGGLSLGMRTAVAFLPLPADLVLLLMILRRVRRLDEFQKRIQLEAVAAAFLATGLAVFLYGYLQKAELVGPLRMGLVWLFMTVFYGIGYFAAVKHYQ